MRRWLTLSCLLLSLLAGRAQALPGQAGWELEHWLAQHAQLEATLHAVDQAYLAAHLQDADGRQVQVFITGSVFDPNYFVRHILPEGKVEKIILQFKPPFPLARLSDMEAWEVVELDARAWLKRLFAWQELDRDFSVGLDGGLIFSGREYWSPARGVSRYKMDSLDRQTEWVGTSRFYQGHRYIYELSRPSQSPWVRCILHAKENGLREIGILKHNESLYRAVHPNDPGHG